MICCVLKNIIKVEEKCYKYYKNTKINDTDPAQDLRCEMLSSY